MHELYALKEKLCKELKKYSTEEVTNSNLPIIDSLSHAIKNIDKIIDGYEEEESGSYGYEPNYRGNRNNRSWNNSYSRGRGRNAKRDSMGRYASDGLVNELRDLMMDAPDEQTRQEYKKVIEKLEMM